MCNERWKNRAAALGLHLARPVIGLALKAGIPARFKARKAWQSPTLLTLRASASVRREQDRSQFTVSMTGWPKNSAGEKACKYKPIRIRGPDP